MKGVAWSALAALMVLPGAPVRASDDKPGQAEVKLCDALEAVGRGQRLAVRVSGIYVVSYERQMLYDPEQRACPTAVQPTTWVEFARSAGKNDALQRALGESSRASVTFRGELYGPQVIGPDDLSLPPLIAYAKRAPVQGYGHLNAFRTKLVVEEVLSARAVPKSEPPWTPEADPKLEVLHAEVPQYPGMPRAAGIEGTVIIEVTVKDGKVTKTFRKAGDRMLAGEATTNIETWQFKPGTDAVFTTTFVYALERRRAGDELPRVELTLPELVKVTAASFEW